MHAHQDWRGAHAPEPSRYIKGKIAPPYLRSVCAVILNTRVEGTFAGRQKSFSLASVLIQNKPKITLKLKRVILGQGEGACLGAVGQTRKDKC